MQIGIITCDGRQVGVIAHSNDGEPLDDFTPDLADYEPRGRAEEAPEHFGAHPHGPHLSHRNQHHFVGHQVSHPGERSRGGYTPRGETYRGEGGRPVHQGTAETDRAIVEASRAYNIDPNFMRSIASIESGMNPASNANRTTQYKGLYQMGSRGPNSEWARFGNGGNIYSAQDNAMAAARYFAANRAVFREHYHRDPTDAEMYMMHQQGLGFYTRGAMTNIAGNPYPHMSGPQTHESFEAGWGREIARRKAAFQAREPKAEPPPKDVTFDPGTMAP